MRAYRVDFDPVGVILRLNCQQQTPKPFQRAKIPANPEKVDLPEPRALAGLIHAVPDALQDGGKWSDPDTGSDKNSGFEFEDVFRGRAEGPVHI